MKKLTVDQWCWQLEKGQRYYLLRELFKFLKEHWDGAYLGTSRMSREDSDAWWKQTRTEPLYQEDLDERLNRHPHDWKDRAAWSRALPALLPGSVIRIFEEKGSPSLKGATKGEVQTALLFDENVLAASPRARTSSKA